MYTFSFRYEKQSHPSVEQVIRQLSHVKINMKFTKKQRETEVSKLIPGTHFSLENTEIYYSRLFPHITNTITSILDKVQKSVLSFIPSRGN